MLVVVFVFICLTFDSRNIALIVTERMVQPMLDRSKSVVWWHWSSRVDSNE